MKKVFENRFFQNLFRFEFYLCRVNNEKLNVKPFKTSTIMKKIFLAIACVFTLATSACADNYQPVYEEQLPERAQIFLATYFPEAKISLARKEIDVMELHYDVIFTDGSKVEFDRKGNWIEVDCLNQPLPSGIVPEAIEKIIRTQYPEAQATKIERDHREFDVKLDNRVELTFNKDMQLVDID